MLGLGLPTIAMGLLCLFMQPNLSWMGLAPAVAGMYVGLRIRHRLDPDLFRRWFLVGLVLLGVYMLLR